MGDHTAARKEAKRFFAFPEARKRGRYEGILAAIAIDEDRYRQGIDLLEQAAAVADTNGQQDDAAAYRSDRTMTLVVAGHPAEARAALAAFMTPQADLSGTRVGIVATFVFIGDLEAARAVVAKLRTQHAECVRQLFAAGEARRRGDPRAAVDALRDHPFDGRYDWYAAHCALDAGVSISPKQARNDLPRG